MKHLLIVLPLVLMSCGVKVSGRVNTSGTVNHRVDLAELEEYFRIYCESVDADRGGVPNANSKKPKPGPSPSETPEPSPEPSETPEEEPAEPTVGDTIDEQERIERCVARKVEEFLRAVK